MKMAASSTVQHQGRHLFRAAMVHTPGCMFVCMHLCMNWCMFLCTSFCTRLHPNLSWLTWKSLCTYLHLSNVLFHLSSTYVNLKFKSPLPTSGYKCFIDCFSWVDLQSWSQLWCLEEEGRWTFEFNNLMVMWWNGHSIFYLVFHIHGYGFICISFKMYKTVFCII